MPYAGLLHLRERHCTPPPQVREQADHSNQGLHPPMIGIRFVSLMHWPWQHTCDEDPASMIEKKKRRNTLMNVLTVCMVPTVCRIVLASKYYTTKVAH